MPWAAITVVPGSYLVKPTRTDALLSPVALVDA